MREEVIYSTQGSEIVKYKEDCLFYNLGCGSDMEQATSLAEKMVKEWSMSENLGFRVYQNSEFGFSDDIKKKVEMEIDSLMQESYERVTSLLSQHKSELDLIANALLLKKTLYGNDVQE
jgi:ATP-dependent Zn protease